MAYLVLVHADGATAMLHFPSVQEAENAFYEVIRQPSVVYAHYAKPFGERINDFARR